MVTVASPHTDMQEAKKTDNRRSNKPIMEKRRRARINNCLNELKALILDAMKKDPARHSKLEKADILEMTVKHLEGLRSEGAGSPDRFKAGYRHCLSEVSKFPGLDTGLKRRLVKHLEGCVNVNRPLTAPTPPSDVDDTSHSTIFISAGPGSGVRLVPTRLSNGDIALVLPAGVSASTLAAVPTLLPLSPREVSSASSEPRCLSPASSGWGSPPPSEEQAPLALVTRRQPEEKPWRPW
ncbi:protein hairy [Danaus plexippus]|uniref:Helix-loop-helix transcription factor n=1 Tax=Danaus plexippus plexippus TaxID=278856 RepID=A0A212EH70_DANPL|nr:protein hairy [Danaus plexippus]XP_032517775.1 protein hairy [Danaus plexippus plexippus]OWR40837.1 Helix-loop-helix transcription factor [Danaus plexippus plexippus]